MRSAWHGAATGLFEACRGYVDADVFDGAPLTADDLNAAVFIGWQPSTTREEPAGKITQQDHDAGLPAARREYGDIRVTILVQSGDLEVAPVRAGAFAILSQIQALLHHVPTASSNGTRPQQAASRFLATWAELSGAQPLRIDVDSVDVTQGHSPQGVYAELDITVSYDALIS